MKFTVLFVSCCLSAVAFADPNHSVLEGHNNIFELLNDNAENPEDDLHHEPAVTTKPRPTINVEAHELFTPDDSTTEDWLSRLERERTTPKPVMPVDVGRDHGHRLGDRENATSTSAPDTTRVETAVTNSAEPSTEAGTSTTEEPTEGTSEVPSTTPDSTEDPTEPTSTSQPISTTEVPTSTSEGPTIPTEEPTEGPTGPTDEPTEGPTSGPTDQPTEGPTGPTEGPTSGPTEGPTSGPTDTPTTEQPDTGKGGKSWTTGSIAGVVIGSLFGAALLVGGILFVSHRMKSRNGDRRPLVEA